MEMNLFENIKSINELIEKNQEPFQFLVEQFNTNFKAKSNVLSIDEFVFKPELFQKLAKFLDLNFENENTSNVCFANDKDLRSEYKDSFSAEDVLNCFVALLNLENEKSFMDVASFSTVLKNNNKAEIQKTFWQLVAMGNK